MKLIKVISWEELKELDEYTFSVPTGAYPGKEWRRHLPYLCAEGRDDCRRHWMVGRYYDMGPVGEVGIVWFDAWITE